MTSVYNSINEPKFTLTENDKKTIALIDQYDQNMLSYVAKLYEIINKDKLDLVSIHNAVDALALFNQKQEYNYLNNLLHPEKCKGVKIPSPIPVPSCAFQLHNCCTLTTNSVGNLGVIFNPFYLGDSSILPFSLTSSVATQQIRLNNSTSLFINNDNTLTGTQPNSCWIPYNIGQDIPNVYDQYRLVSASVVIKYIGRLDIASGVIGGAIVFDESPYIGGSISVTDTSTSTTTSETLGNPNLIKYGNFDLAMDSFYHQENLSIEGLRELYFPIDNSFEEYIKLTNYNNATNSKLTYTDGTTEQTNKTCLKIEQDYYKSGFNFFIYVLGAPPNSSCFKLDIYCNYECLPNASFLNYLPLTITPGPISNKDKHDATLYIQKKPIMKISEITPTPKIPSLWERMIKKFKNNLPGIKKLITNSIVQAIPILKPGLALANSLLALTSSSTPPDITDDNKNKNNFAMDVTSPETKPKESEIEIDSFNLFS